MKSCKKHLKKIISGLTALSMLTAMSIPAVSADTLAGDLNEDGAVNAVDFVLMKKYIINAGELGEQAMLNADMNSSGEVNIFDAIFLAKQLVTNQSTDPTEPSETEASTITLLGTSIETSSSTVVIDGTTATITVPGVYTITGTLDDGQIIVDVDKTTYPTGAVELSLEGVDIASSNNSPVYIASIADECTITAKKGTDNVISDGSSYTNADEDSGAIYSKDDLKIKGKGNLTVNGNCADGIVGKDDVKIYNGNITVNAVDDGIRGKDSVRIGNIDDLAVEGAYDNLSVTITTQSGDGITATNTTDEGKGYITVNGGTLSIDSYADGLQAEQALTVNGGTIDISTYEGSSFSGNVSSGNTGGWGGGMQDGNSNKTDISAKGLKSGGTLDINGGTINIDSSDDCIHSAGNLNLYGGYMTLASADDACHSDTDLTIGNGTADTFDDVKILISTCYEGIEAINITQNSGTVIVNSIDDGYNAAGGADGSGTTNPGGWNPGGGMGSGGNYSMNLNGGFALVNATDGDHDGFDSNGSITISGGYFISNGNEPFDSDGSKTYSGGVYIIDKGSGGMGGMGGSEMASTVTASCSANAGTRITLADGENVIVSFVADKSVTSLTAGCNAYTSAKFYTGGTITGTSIAELGSQICYVGGTISGGTELTSGSSGGNTNPWG
ncbi:MAG: carbohydrate-binding domain-containing protein [Oscillospiraceae bacterium]